MPTYISMLRGINVAGQKKINMKELKTLYESLNFENVTTYIQSGNVIFKSSNGNSAALAKKIEEVIQKKYKFEVTVFIKTKEELEQIIAKNPFTKRKNIDLERLYVTFLSGISDSTAHEKITKLITQHEEFAILETEIYLYCPLGYGRTKLSNNFLENKTKLSGTTRNWRTVNTLLKMAE